MKYLYYLLFTAFIVVSCTKDTTPTEIVYEEIPLEEEIKLATDLIVKVDPRIELLSVVQHFTNWSEIYHTKFESRYIKDIDEYFKNYKNHNAVILSRQLTNASFNYDAPPTFVLSHGAPPELVQEVPYTDYLIKRAGSEKKLVTFADALREFAKETSFMTFFETEKSFYRKIENDTKRTIGDFDYIKFLEDYYGKKQSSYNVILASLFHSGGFGTSIERDEGYDIYDICGPLSSSNGIPNFGDLDNFQYILFHEFSHSFVNPLTESHLQEINEFKNLYEPIRSKMAEQSYTNWETCLNEHLIRVNVARFRNILKNSEEKKALLDQEYDKGFIYVYGLDSLMHSYESDRSKFPSYDSFYIEIINYLKTIN